MANVELLELKFRLFDGTDIGPNKYASASTVSAVKESIIAQWPKGKENAPKTIDDIKLINAGRILENKETLTESRLPINDLPGGVITMLVVVHLQPSNKKAGHLYTYAGCPRRRHSFHFDSKKMVKEPLGLIIILIFSWLPFQ